MTGGWSKSGKNHESTVVRNKGRWRKERRKGDTMERRHGWTIDAVGQLSGKWKEGRVAPLAAKISPFKSCK